jgi:SAM-dependent methyltransferase
VTVIDNPLLAFWTQTTGLPEHDPEGLNDWRRDGCSAERAYLDRTSELCRARHRAIDRWSFAVPSDEALSWLLQLGPLVEVGAGTGYWAALLAARGADVVACDLRRPRGQYRQEVGAYHPVENLDAAEAAAAHPERALLLVWPPYDEDMAVRALEAYRGPVVAYIGESDGGCTGDEAFHAALDAHWFEAHCVSIPQWWGVHDRLYIFRRRD